MTVTPAAAAAMAPRDHLGEFEGRDILRTTVAITQAGDGLSEALAVAPSAHGIGDTVYVLMACTVADVRFLPADKDDPDMGLVRRHTLRAGTATLVDRETAQPLIVDQRRRIDEARGTPQLPIAGETAPQPEWEDGDGDITSEVRDINTRRKGRGKAAAEGEQ